jgi:hypothetical protein
MAFTSSGINNGTLTKFLANIFVFLCAVGALCLFGYDVVTAQQTSSYVLTILGTSLGAAIKITGVDTGADVATNAITQASSTMVNHATSMAKTIVATSPVTTTVPASTATSPIVINATSTQPTQGNLS